MVLWTTGVVLGGATIPTLMGNTAPLWVGLGALLLLRERQTVLFWVGLVLAMAGAATVLAQDLARASEFGLGALLGLGAGFFYGSYQLITQRGRAWLDTLSYFAIATASSGGFLLAFNLLAGQPLAGYSRLTWLVFLAAGALSQVGAWLAINYAQGYLPASIVAPALLGQPVITALLSALFFGETFTGWHLLGGIGVLAGVALVHRSRAVVIRQKVEYTAQGNPREVEMIKIDKDPSEERLSELGVLDWPIWQKEASRFAWSYDSSETCYVLKGRVTVTPDDGEPVEIEPGDLVTFPQGMSCTWHITEDIKKHYTFD